MSAAPGGAGAETQPRVSRRRLLVSAVLFAGAAVALYLLLPRLAGLDDTWRRVRNGDPLWLLAAAGLEVLSYAGYVVLFRRVLARPPSWLGLRESVLISIAGVAATRLLAAGGAGGIALTAWALRRSGQPARMVGARMTAFMVILYGIYMTVLVVGGFGLYAGVLPGPAPAGLTLVPGIFGAAVIVVALLLALVPHELAWRHSRRRVVRWVAVGSATVGDGVREALALVRAREWRAIAAAAAWWGFDIAVLWACLHAFGGSPPVTGVVMAYFVGMLGNLLPLPGGIGGVDGGMIAALIGFGVPGGLAIAAVLSYRAFSFWLPTVPGILAYLRLLHDVRGWGPGGPLTSRGSEPLSSRST
jgi:uncharacterized membrane protein YbhN (UPF0104 family)